MLVVHFRVGIGQVLVEVVLVGECFVAAGAGQAVFFDVLSDHVSFYVCDLPGHVVADAAVPLDFTVLTNCLGHVVQHTWNTGHKAN